MSVQSTDSFLLNHSPAYHLAAIASWSEYALETLYLPTWKPTMLALTYLGVAMCLGGEVLRKSAMFEAGKNFNHIVQDNKDPEHKLITSGVFGLYRHPSYVGWFYWSIGTQLILRNPFCTVAYALASWTFFKERIVYEEWTLLRFFGREYEEYKKKVPTTGLPFIEGFKLDQ